MEFSEQIDEKLHEIEHSNISTEKKYETARSIARDLAIAIEGLNSRIDNLEEEKQIVDSRLDSLCNQVDRVESHCKELEHDKAELAHRMTQLEDDAIETPGVRTELELSKLERILLVDDLEPDGIIEERAVEIAKNWSDWANSPRAKEYDSILSARKNNLKTHLEAARDENLQWIQIHRSMDALEELSDGKITVFEGDRIGKALGIPSDTDLAFDKSDIRFS